ncbi:MAG: excinuclease ABC subunit UvrC [Kiritimatiellae bacterium]|nr:excinuclease ABC subunit UvrC [Kiritimatiellia bacterium]
MNDVLRERLKTVPNKPGCYMMRDRAGAIIYVGKAKNLRRRVLGYFRPNADLAPKVRSMVHTVADLEFMTVKNEAEALLTEANLIKKYKPHFNILMRDDKRYLALRADPSQDFPFFATCRIVRDDGARYFGPFPSATVVRTAKDFVEKRYGLRGCTCLSPDEEAHVHCLADTIRFCSAPCLGRVSSEEYKARFDEACAFLRGERPQVIADVQAQMRAAAAKNDFEKAAKLRDVCLALKEMTKQHFVRRRPEETRADAMRGLEELAAALRLAAPPRVIECADISNLFGTHSVASLVVAVDGLPDRRCYRHFKIETVEGADDPRSMAEVVRRRYGPGSTLAAKSPKADLFVCDGGVTQLRAARAAFREIGVADVPVVGLAEKMEIIVTDDERGEIALPRDSQGLFVATRLRDEAHRFAITYHRNLRERAIRESALDEVPGIGPAKKAALLRAFKSTYGIARATVAEIAAAAGVGTEIAEAVLAVCSRRRAAEARKPLEEETEIAP